MDIKIPEFADDDWLREQVNALRTRIEGVVEEEESYSNLYECLEILDALQQYAGY